MGRKVDLSMVGSTYGCFLIEERAERRNTTTYYHVRCITCNTRSQRAMSYLKYARLNNWTNCPVCKSGRLINTSYIVFDGYIRILPSLRQRILEESLTEEEMNQLRRGAVKCYAGDSNIVHEVPSPLAGGEIKVNVSLDPIKSPAWRITPRAWQLYFNDPNAFERRSDAAALWKNLEMSLDPELVNYMLHATDDGGEIVWTSSPAPEGMLWVYPTLVGV